MKTEIDLHGVKHADVKRVLDLFFWEMIRRNIRSFNVITGFSQKMKNIVIEVSDEYGFKVEHLPTNGGLLIIKN